MARPYVLFLSLLLAVACSSRLPQARQYELQGAILPVGPEPGQLLIEHGDIKNFMRAMTMPDKGRPKALLDGKVPERLSLRNWRGDAFAITFHEGSDRTAGRFVEDLRRALAS